MSENLYIVSLSNAKEERVEGMKTLVSLVEAFGEAVSVVEQGRRALTVELRDQATLPQLMDKVADIADVQVYEGLKVPAAEPKIPASVMRKFKPK